MTTFDDILNDPDSDELRLELAAAWSESDATRSDFVRHQVELARGEGEAREHVAALARVAIPAEWEAELAHVGLKHPKYRPAWDFRRGFVEHVTTTAKWILAHGDELFARVPVRSLLLTKVGDPELRELGERPWLSRLRHLGLVSGASAPLVDLLGSQSARRLWSLELNWEAAQPHLFPKDLGPKALDPVIELLGGGHFPELRAFRVAISSAKLALRVATACRAVRQLGLRAQGGWDAKGSSALGAALDGPELRSLEVSTLAETLAAPALERLTVASIATLPSPELLQRLESLCVSHMQQTQLEQVCEHEMLRLRELTLHMLRADDAPWRALARGRFPALSALSIAGGQPLAASEASARELRPVFARLESADACLDGASSASLIHEGAERLKDVRLTWTGSTSDAPFSLPASCERVSIRCGPDDDAIDLLLRCTLPRLVFFASSGAPAEGSGRRLLTDASPTLSCLWLRAHRLPRDLERELRQRFVVYDSGPKYDGSRAGMTDWNWPHHTWSPPPWEPSRRALV